MSQYCRSYILLVLTFCPSEMLHNSNPTSKLSDNKLSHIANGRYIFLHLYKNLPLNLLNLFPYLLLLIFEYWSLLFVSFIILTLHWLGRGVQWTPGKKTGIALNPLFCLGLNFTAFPTTYSEIF